MLVKINENMKNDILSNVIKVIFPVLANDYQYVLLDRLVSLIDHICLSFGITQEGVFLKQLTQNNYLDTTALLLMLLPHINDDDHQKKKQMRTFDDLYTKKEKIEDPLTTEPLYVYSNIQYGRYNRTTNKEIMFEFDHIEQNYQLLLLTITQISNKLFPNWVDIFPYSLDTYRSTLLYKTTNKIFARGWIDTNYKKNSKHVLTISDIYETLAHDFYNNIKIIRWMIYDIQCETTKKERMYPLVILLNEIIDLTPCVNNIEWENTPMEYQQNFEKSFELLISNTGQYVTTKNCKINRENVIRMIIGIYEYFNYYYPPTEGYIKIDNYESYKKQSEYTYQLLFNSVKKHIISAKKRYVYDFIRITIQKYKNTWFGTKILNYSVGGKQTIYSLNGYEDNVKQYGNMTIKMVYNYAKSLCNKLDRDELESYPLYWRGMEQSQRKTIITKLNDKENEGLWFHIGRYVKNIIEANVKKSNKQTITKMQEIYTEIREHLMECIFECMIVQGVLTKFEPDATITDKSLYTEYDRQIYSRISDNLKNEKHKYDNSYHFLLGIPYKHTTVQYRYNNMLKTGTYIEYLQETPIKEWCLLYAMNWVSQIAFFHKYLNNRIIFVTGSTGVGKSTQIPKLLLYAQKMIEHKTNCRIVCTMPRIIPVETVSLRVSEELGVHIKTLENEKTSNYYVQYEFKDRNKSHSKMNTNLMLKFVTDRIVYNSLTSNPLLKTTTINNEEIKYSSSNLYDIVVVDEAHEHNINMDMIFTLMRYSLYFNNTIKLVIMSATMDADEPIYRRFFRDINDNRMAPVNTFIERMKLDRINVDRRLHISIPGQGTRHTITEIYGQTDLFDILSKIPPNSGDIMIFQPGLSDIKKTVNMLNKTLTGNILAIPYYSELSDEKKDLIINFNTKRSTIRTPKYIPFELDDGKVIVPPYDTYIIVATNIAETSLSIESLKYVIDTGTRKVKRFDYKRLSSYLETIIISDFNRIQRKGRVGRKSAGIVYYMYDENKTKTTKQVYPISESDLSDMFFELLQYTPILTGKQNPNRYGFDIKFTDLQRKYKNGLHKLIKQYYINDRYYSYYGQSQFYDYEKTVIPHLLYTKTVLDDPNGTFYIVHPEETSIKRNILGEIIELEPNAYGLSLINKTLTSQKMAMFWNSLIRLGFMTNTFIKSDLGNYIYDLRQRFDIDNINFLITLAYSYRLNCHNDVLKLIAMLTATNMEFKNIVSSSIVNGKYLLNIQELYTLFNSKKGDCYALLNICDKFFNEFNIPTDFTNIEYLIRSIKNDYLNKKLSSPELTRLFGLLTKINILNTNISSMSISEINKTLAMDFIESYLIDKYTTSDLVSWCEKNYIKYNTFVIFIKQYSKLLNKSFKYINQIRDDNLSYDPNWFRTNLVVHEFINDPFMYSLLKGFCFNIAFRINGSELFISAYNPYPLDIFKIKDVSSRLSETLCNYTLNMTNFILYLNKNPELDYITMITPLNFKFSLFLDNIYNEKLEYNPLLYKELVNKITDPKYTKLITIIVPIYGDLLHSLKRLILY